jgi:large subunit ribosomal protein L2
MTTVSYAKTLTKGAKPKKSLLVTLKTHAGRNSSGRITMRHQGGGNKRRYRLVDFKQTKFLGVPAEVDSIQYDPYRTCFIALIKYQTGEFSYVLAPQGLKVGDTVVADETVPLTPGNRMRLGNVPPSFRVYNVEMQPGKGGQLARSAGGSIEVMAHEGIYTTLKMPSGEVRKVLSTCYASLGELSNPEHNLVVIGKAGRSRWLGKRPTVRGNAMNPVDHPHGGGEGKQPRGTRKPKDIWGNITGGKKTRSKTKPSSKFIVKRRPSRLSK